MAEITVLALSFCVVRFVRVLALRRSFRIAFLVVTGPAHILGAVLFVHVLAYELLTEFLLVELLESLAMKLFVLPEVGVHHRQILNLDRADRVTR